jgi:2-oxoglutarate dehydrogenase E1 component
VLRRQIHRDFRKPVSFVSLTHYTVNLTGRVKLILFFSKSLLRHPRARSELHEMLGETHFQRYLPDPHPDSLVQVDKIRRHILCTGNTQITFSWGILTVLVGQIYHTLLQEREERGIADVAISRLEQLSPFPYDLVCDIIVFRQISYARHSSLPILICIPMQASCGARCANLTELSTLLHVLQQEEPLNNGAWSYVGPRIFTAANRTAHHKGKYPSYAGRGPTSSVATGSKVGNTGLLKPWMILTMNTHRYSTRKKWRHSLLKHLNCHCDPRWNIRCVVMECDLCIWGHL